jgi:multidrug efflux pump subunit AcrB
VPENVFLDYSQERLAGYGLQPSKLRDLLKARNIAMPGGTMEVGRKNVAVDPSGEFTSEKAIGDVIVGSSPSGSPVYLRDLVKHQPRISEPREILELLHRAG